MTGFVYLQFSLQAALTSRAIAWFTQGKVSHVDCLLPSMGLLGSRSDRCVGIAPGVQIRPPGYAKFASKIVVAMPATVAQQQAHIHFLVSQLGRPYDHQAIWGFILGRDWRETDSWICSELQAAALEFAGIVPKLCVTANKITPAMLLFGLVTAGGRIL